MDKFALSLTQAMAGDEWPLQFLWRPAAPGWRFLPLFASEHC